jgi:translation initiation factor 5B
VLNLLRQPIITIMGHIDSGKTTLLDKIKGTFICEKEAGKITQHIGATEININAIKCICGHLVNKFNFELKINGLLFIDTPGHSAFDNLRERGGSLADLVVLIIDINKGLQTQDIETLQILKLYKVPFIVLANKIDLIKGWTQNQNDVSLAISKQSKEVKDILDEKLYKIVGELYNNGFSAERFDRVDDFKKTVALIPISATKQWGIPECVLFLTVLSQKFLDKKLELDPNSKAQATVLEVGELNGFGATADTIVYQGVLRTKQEIIFPTKNGYKKSKIKALLKINVLSAVDKKKQEFENVDFVSAASGVKLVAPGINECLPGGAIVCSDDLEAVKNLKNVKLACFENTSEKGAFIKTDTLGSLEALRKLFQKENICVAKSDIGEVTNKDITELKILHNKDPKKGVLFLFNTKISKELEEEINKLKIQIFKNNIIYKLIEDYKIWLESVNKKEKDKLLKEIIYPCKFKILRNHIFRSSKPAVVGVKILEGRLVINSSVAINNKNVGEISGIQSEGKSISVAKTEQEVAVSIKNATYLKDFKEDDVLEVQLNLNLISKLENVIEELDSNELDLIKNAKKRIYSSNDN